MSRLGETILVLAVVIGVGIFAATRVTCWHIPYIVSTCNLK